MSSIFKSKRISSDSKSASSKSGKESDSSKSQRNSGSSSSKSGPGGTSTAGGGGGAAPHHSTKVPNHSSSKAGKAERSQSVDVSVWADEDCPAIDSRFAGSTVNDKTLSISRSGRYKAKGKIRTSLFSDDSVDGTDVQGLDKRGTTRGSSSSSYEDRPTVLHMTGRPAAEPSGRNALSNHVKPDVSSSNWSATPSSVDL